jgi:16S rRNA (guanine966-N2)-methyltransferase
VKHINAAKTEIRIVAGTLRGRKITAVVHDGLRPTPQRVRESLFSILGNAVPGRAFYDLFAGTGVVGLEAISRGASEAWLLEADSRSASAIEKMAIEFGVAAKTKVLRADIYRWAERWLPPPSPVTVFLSPPFPDLEGEKVEKFLAMVVSLRSKLPPDSVLAIQAETGFPTDRLPNAAAWDCRAYGRNLLMFDVVELPAETKID